MHIHHEISIHCPLSSSIMQTTRNKSLEEDRELYPLEHSSREIEQNNHLPSITVQIFGREILRKRTSSLGLNSELLLSWIISFAWRSFQSQATWVAFSMLHEYSSVIKSLLCILPATGSSWGPILGLMLYGTKLKNRLWKDCLKKLLKTRCAFETADDSLVRGAFKSRVEFFEEITAVFSERIFVVKLGSNEKSWGELTNESLYESLINSHALVEREQELHESWQARVCIQNTRQPQ